MRYLGIAVLSLIALATGGCSGIFLIAALLEPNIGDGFSLVGIPALLGLGIAALCIWGIRALRRPRAPAPPVDPNDTSKGRW